MKHKRSYLQFQNFRKGVGSVVALFPGSKYVDPSNTASGFASDDAALRGDINRITRDMIEVAQKEWTEFFAIRSNLERVQASGLTEQTGRTRISVIGVGGAGGEVIEHMIGFGVKGVEYIYANTDSHALSRSSAHRIIQLGTGGLGAGGNPFVGRNAALATENSVRSAIEGTHLLFVVAGLGAGTGTGAAPIIARIAREMGILTVGLVTLPFHFEGASRIAVADRGVALLEANVDSLIVLPLEKLFEVLGGDISQDQAFAHVKDEFKASVEGLAELLNAPGHLNIDFEDIRNVLSEGGKAILGIARASGPDRARVASEKAMAPSLFGTVDISDAKSVLVLITAAKGSLKLSESRLAMNSLRAHASPTASVIYGTSYDDRLGDDIRVTVVATGISSPNMSMKFTGTDKTHTNAAWLADSLGKADAASTVTPKSSENEAINSPPFLRKQQD